MKTSLTALAAAAVAVVATGVVAAPANAYTPDNCVWKAKLTVHCGKPDSGRQSYRAVIVCRELKSDVVRRHYGKVRISGARGQSSTANCASGEVYQNHGVKTAAVAS